MEEQNMEDKTEDNPSKSEPYKFGCHMLKTLFGILRILMEDKTCLIYCLLIGLISLLLEYIIYNVGIIPSGFYKYLVEKDWDSFVRHMIISVLLILAIAFVLSFRQYLTSIFRMCSREVLTNSLQNLYFKLNRFYFLNNLAYQLTDNPDQRITQDVDKFTEQLSLMIAPVVVSPFVIGYYTYTCFTTTGWIGPVVIFCVFVVSVIINKFLIKPVMNMVIKQEKYEGFFRFKHMHVRTYAESIALQGSQKAEHVQSSHHLNNLIRTQESLYLRQFPLNIAINVFNYIGSIISYLILSQPVFAGKYDNFSPAEIGGLISNNAFFSIYLISAFSKLVDLSSSLSELAGLTYRVSELLNLVSSTEKESLWASDPYDDENGQSSEDSLLSEDDVAIEFRDVSFGSPSNPAPLVSRLSLKICLGTNLLITGNSSSGKTSILRIIRGLWNVQEGKVERYLKFSPANIFFLPQKPLMTDGSILDQIRYPMLPKKYQQRHHSTNGNMQLHLIYSYIEYVELQHVVDKAGGLDVVVDWNWNSMLSPGEAQRLSFVRLFYHKPKLAFLDEATSAMSPQMENKMYEKCKDLQITVVTIGHNVCLTAYHSAHLHLEGNGAWTLRDIAP